MFYVLYQNSAKYGPDYLSVSYDYDTMKAYFFLSSYVCSCLGYALSRLFYLFWCMFFNLIKEIIQIKIK